MEKNIDIRTIQKEIEDLGKGFDRLINSNPYLLYLENKKKKSENINDYEKFRLYDSIRIFKFILLGFGLAVILMAIYLYVYLNYENYVVTVVQIISGIFTILILIMTLFIRQITKEDLYKNKNSQIIIGTVIISSILTFYGIFKGSQLIFIIIPIVNYVVVIFLLFTIYNPLSSKALRDTIVEKTTCIENKLTEVNSFSKKIEESVSKDKYFSFIQEVKNSHSSIEKKVISLEDKIVQNKLISDELLKTQTLSVLDLIKLELIKSSRNGINLIENWDFIEPSQNMINEIMDCKENNKHITIVGDLGFLSSDEGLKILINSIISSNKTFHIYFTGRKKAGKKNVIVSEQCNLLISNFKSHYSSHPEKEMIINSINLIPIVSDAFTGIGFIGISTDHGENYNKVYSYISSLIIQKTPETNIIRANPFVFSWKNNTSYFSNFIKANLNGNLKVEINGEDVNSKNLLKI